MVFKVVKIMIVNQDIGVAMGGVIISTMVRIGREGSRVERVCVAK